MKYDLIVLVHHTLEVYYNSTVLETKFCLTFILNVYKRVYTTLTKVLRRNHRSFPRSLGELQEVTQRTVNPIKFSFFARQFRSPLFANLAVACHQQSTPLKLQFYNEKIKGNHMCDTCVMMIVFMRTSRLPETYKHFAC